MGVSFQLVVNAERSLVGFIRIFLLIISKTVSACAVVTANSQRREALIGPRRQPVPARRSRCQSARSSIVHHRSTLAASFAGMTVAVWAWLHKVHKKLTGTQRQYESRLMTLICIRLVQSLARPRRSRHLAIWPPISISRDAKKLRIRHN